MPAGAIGLDERVAVPVVGLPSTVAREARRTIARGAEVTVSLGAPGWSDNPDGRRVALFSSHGLAFGGGVKPEVIAPGVELITSDVGRNEDQSARYSTISGSSAAAALAAGMAAVLVQARPGLDAHALKGVLVGAAAPSAGTSVSAQGAGTIDGAGAVATELAAAPATIGFGAADQAGWQSIRRVTVTNVSTRRLRLAVQADTEGITGIAVRATPRELRIRPGRSVRLTVRARAAFLPRRPGAVFGSVRLVSRGGGSTEIPWAVALPAGDAPLVSDVKLSAARFRRSDRAPAVLSMRAGNVRLRGARMQLQPLSRLDVELWRGSRRVGLLARLRDVLPGNYAFGVTGRGPRGRPLPRGAYRLRIIAVPPDGQREFATVGFTLR